jgi:hypothetical protein
LFILLAQEIRFAFVYIQIDAIIFAFLHILEEKVDEQELIFISFSLLRGEFGKRGHCIAITWFSNNKAAENE